MDALYLDSLTAAAYAVFLLLTAVTLLPDAVYVCDDFDDAGVEIATVLEFLQQTADVQLIVHDHAAAAAPVAALIETQPLH